MIKPAKRFSVEKCYCSDDDTTEKLLISDIANFPTLTFTLTKPDPVVNTYTVVGPKNVLKDFLGQYYDCGDYTDAVKEIKPV